MSQEEIIVALAVIVVFGIGAQWLARRRDFPALLLLLPAGLLAGNVGDLVQPEELFGDTLFPGVTLLVGLLLFSSGLRLRFAELPVRARGPVIRLNTVAAMITLLGAAGVTWLVIRPSWHLALLTGAILVVSGPTVVGPLLDSVRPREPVDSILRWEGTVLDPIGATMGVIALNLVLAAQREGIHPVFQMGGRLALGVGVGLVAGALLVFVMSRFLVTDEMEAAVSLLFAVLAFSVAEYFLSEAGLFATVTLGLVVANQRVVPTGRIEGFGETLEVIIIGGLFVVLGALVDIDDLVDRGWRIAVVVALLVVLVRPLSVAVSLFRTRVDLRGRAMIAWLDPRGVVAAATAASFAGTLALAGIDAEFLLPVVFGVILGTGVLYGLTAAPVAAALGVRRDPPNGLIIVDGGRWAGSLADSLARVGVPAVVATTDPPGAGSGRTVSIEELVGEENVRSLVAREGIGKAVVVLSHDPRMQMLVADLVEVLGRRRVYRVRSADATSAEAHMLRAATAVAFGPSVTDADIESRAAQGWVVAEMDATGADAQPADGEDTPLVLAIVDPDGTVHVGEHRTDPAAAVAGARVVGLRPPEP